MGFFKTIEKIITSKPIEIEGLNRRATLEERKISEVNITDPLEDVIITKEYETVVTLLKEHCPIVFVTGNAGTGKSTLIRYIKNVCDKKIVVLAPTGVAALNAGGVTIHSFFQFPPKILEEKDIKNLSDRNLYQKLELLIIDEVSMLRGEILDGIDKFLRKNRSNKKPFGGVQLLLIGDLFQLPPVIPKQEWDVLKDKGYKSPYFFSSFSLQKASLVPVELTTVYRQEDSSFVDILNQIRVGQNLELLTEKINKNCYKREDINSVLTLTCTNYLADQINQRELDNLSSKEFSFTGNIEGKFSLEHDKLPSPFVLRLKKGAQVMFTKNDELKRWVNGTIGVISDIDQDSIRVEVDSKAAYDLRPAIWETYRYYYNSEKDQIEAKKVGQYTQYPLMLAWAVTIHKSQGKTLAEVNVDLGKGAFAFGQVYVALSRCQSMEGITLLRPMKKTDVRCDPIIKRFYIALTEL